MKFDMKVGREHSKVVSWIVKNQDALDAIDDKDFTYLYENFPARMELYKITNFLKDFGMSLQDILDGVRKSGNIYSNMFEQNEDITKLTKEDFKGIRVIGDAAFWACTNLTEVVMSDDVEFVCSCAFTSCDMLKRLVLSKNIIQFDISSIVMDGELGKIEYNGTMESLQDETDVINESGERISDFYIDFACTDGVTTLHWVDDEPRWETKI